MRMNLAVILMLGTVLSGAYGNFESDLRETLMKDYDPMALPKQKTKVQVGFTIIDYVINEEAQTLDMNMWMKFQWNDSRLEWNPRDYPGIDKLAFNYKKVWRPDFYLYNNADHSNFDVFAGTKILSMIDKGMIWVPPAHLKAMCVMDLTYWPYDTQECHAKFGSWVYSAEEMVVFTQEHPVTFETVGDYSHSSASNVSRGGWDMIKSYTKVVSKRYDCCEEEYLSVSLYVKVKRNEPSYGWIVGIPCVVTGLLSLMVFLFPPSASEKIILGGFVFIAELFFLLALSKMIGHAAHNTPLIVQMVGWQLVFIAIKLIISILVVRLTRDPFSFRLPAIIGKLAEKFGPTLGLGTYVEETRRGCSDELVDGNKVSSTTRNECMLVGAFIDRVCFIFFAFVFFVFIIRFPIFF